MYLHFKLALSFALGLAVIPQAVMGSAIITVKGFGFNALDIQQQTEKSSRTAAQKKIDSQLLYALKQKRGITKGVPTEPIEIEVDQKGRAVVVITAIVTPQVRAEIRKLGGEVISDDARYHTIRAMLALEKLEALARLKDVRFIAPPAKAMNSGKPN